MHSLPLSSPSKARERSGAAPPSLSSTPRPPRHARNTTAMMSMPQPSTRERLREESGTAEGFLRRCRWLVESCRCSGSWLRFLLAPLLCMHVWMWQTTENAAPRCCTLLASSRKQKCQKCRQQQGFADDCLSTRAGGPGPSPSEKSPIPFCPPLLLKEKKRTCAPQRHVRASIMSFLSCDATSV